MPTEKREKQHVGQGDVDRQKLVALIGKHVLDALGRPVDFREVQVRSLWGNQYRVNVFTGTDAASVKIVNSYFVVTDGAGKVLEMTPNVQRQY